MELVSAGNVVITEPHSNLIQTILKNQPEGKWQLDRAKDLPAFPLYKAVTVHDNSGIVLSRIDNVLRQRSVEASFDYNKSQIMCKTSNFLEYSIDLYVGKDDPDNVTVLEIIRRSGCSFMFRQERQAIIQAAKIGENEPKKFKKPSSFTIPADLLGQCNPPSRDELSNTLKRAVEDIHNCNPDARLFILQNLVSMTCSESDHLPSESARTMSTLVLEDNDAFSRDLIVESVKSSIATNKNLDEQMINACLSILFNVMDTMKRADVKKYNTFLNSTNGMGYVEHLLPSLIKQVSNLKSIHNSCLAMKCLSLVAGSSVMTFDKIPSEVIENAIDYGKKRHSEMQKSAQSFLNLKELSCS